MKVSIPWLKELVKLNISDEDLINLLPLRSISIKDVVGDSIELDMKGYNRADLLSLRGVAQEVAAITDSKINFSDEEAEIEHNIPEAKVKVSETSLCPVYCIAKIDYLKVEQSPDSWVKKLHDSGIRSINNVADVTNLIMIEYGQPMHAFDARAVKDEEIIVRSAHEGERITTLDGKTKDLETSDLLIADSLNALGIAGVMGGKDSEITDSTTTILLEAAIFNPVNIRKTAQRLRLPSEASRRFQHGLAKKRLLQALNAAIRMYEDLGGKLTTLAIVGDLTDPVKKVNLTQEKINSLIGVEIKPEDVERYLTELGFSLASQGQALRAWEVIVPYWRLDIELEEDLIEEIARMYGYEKIPAKQVLESKSLQKEDPIFQKIYDLKSKLVEIGLTEIQTYSFYSTKIMEALNLNDSSRESLVKVANPISSETEYLRDSLWPNLVEVVDKNLRKGFKDIAIFEIGKVFSNIDDKPVEDYRLAIALSNGTDNPLEELLALVRHFKLVPESDLKEIPNQVRDDEFKADLFHPKRFISLEKDGKQIGTLAEVHLRVLNKLGIEKRVAVLEINL